MPLALGKRNIGRNIETEQAAGKPHDQAVAIALDVARKSRDSGGAIIIRRDEGGAVDTPSMKSSKLHTGAIHSSVAGRTDHLPIHVPSGSYVIPADIVSGMGEGNTIAGFKHMRRMFGGEPYGAGSHPYNQTGGPYGMAKGGKTSGVPIVAAGGEYVLHPDQVRDAGGGDLDMGHRVLDEFVLRMRKELVKTLKKLPGPAKS